MTYLVPYDSSDHAKAGLYRAREFGDALGSDVHVVSVVPDDPNYARGKGWIGDSESFDINTITGRLREEIEAIAPDARFRCIHIERRATRGTIAGRLRQALRNADADVLVVGSENAGRVVTSTSSIGGSVSSGSGYDVFIVRRLPDDPEFRELL